MYMKDPYDREDALELCINDHSCEGLEEDFAEWVRKTYPNIVVSVGPFPSSFRDENGDDVPELFWDEFCGMLPEQGDDY